MNFNPHLSKIIAAHFQFIYFCRMKIRIIKFLIASLIVTSSFGQEKWDLRKCVEYALEHNITVKQTDLQARFSALALKESKASQIPNLGLGLNAQYRFGLSENPATGVLEDNNFFSASR